MAHVYRMVLDEAGIELEPPEATGLTPAATAATSEAEQEPDNEEATADEINTATSTVEIAETPQQPETAADVQPVETVAAAE